MSTTTLYGLTVATDFPLPETPASPGARIDVVISSGDPVTTWEPQPDGEVVLDFATDQPWYTLVRLADGGYHHRIHTLCDATISADLTQVRLRMHRDVNPGMDAVMTTGNLLSLLLFLRGTPVFHGSAVDVGGAAIAVVGQSGQGKTTTATLLCAEGGAAVTDDVLVIDDPGDGPRVRRGSAGLRLRSGAQALAPTVDDASVRISADSRQVLQPRLSVLARIPLKAILIPFPTRDGSPLRFERLPAMQAAITLPRYPRLMGWRDPGIQQAMLRTAAAVAATTPVIIARIPWGPPFPHGITESLMETLGQ